MTAEQARMKGIIEAFQKYVATYNDQKHCFDYEDRTFIADMLYGIGIAVDPQQFSFAGGFDKFKDALRSVLAGQSANRRNRGEAVMDCEAMYRVRVEENEGLIVSLRHSRSALVRIAATAGCMCPTSRQFSRRLIIELATLRFRAAKLTLLAMLLHHNPMET